MQSIFNKGSPALGIGALANFCYRFMTFMLLAPKEFRLLTMIIF